MWSYSVCHLLSMSSSVFVSLQVISFQCGACPTEGPSQVDFGLGRSSLFRTSPCECGFSFHRCSHTGLPLSEYQLDILYFSVFKVPQRKFPQLFFQIDTDTTQVCGYWWFDPQPLVFQHFLGYLVTYSYGLDVSPISHTLEVKVIC